MYRDRFGTNWERCSVAEAIRRAFALGAATALGEGVDGEHERLLAVPDTPGDRRMVELAFDEGRARARGRRGDGEATWAAVVSGDHEFATTLADPRQDPDGRVPRGMTEAVGRPRLLDEPGDGLDRHRLPGFLGRRDGDDED
jgi:hypothetical protein